MIRRILPYALMGIVTLGASTAGATSHAHTGNFCRGEGVSFDGRWGVYNRTSEFKTVTCPILRDQGTPWDRPWHDFIHLQVIVYDRSRSHSVECSVHVDGRLEGSARTEPGASWAPMTLDFVQPSSVMVPESSAVLRCILPPVDPGFGAESMVSIYRADEVEK